MKISKQFYKPTLVILLAVVVIAVVAIRSLAFTGPTQSGGVGSGAIGVGTGGNISIGTPTPMGNTTALIVGSSSDSNYYAMKILNAAQNPLAIFRNDGAVAIGTTTLVSNTLTLGGNITVAGSLASTISAINVSAGTFGSSTGGGNFSFPGNVGIGTAAPAGLFDLGPAIGVKQFVYGGGGTSGYQMGIGINLGQTPSSLSLFMPGAGGPSNSGVEIVTPNQTTWPYSSYTTRLSVLNNGNVGIGTSTPGQKLSVVGTIESTSGGFKFPDGTTQVTAAAGVLPHFQTFTSGGTWTWPAGVGMVWVTMCGGGGGGGTGGGGGAGGGAGLCYTHFPVAVAGNVSVTVGGGGGALTSGGSSAFGALTVSGGGNGQGDVAGACTLIPAGQPNGGGLASCRAGAAAGGPMAGCGGVFSVSGSNSFANPGGAGGVAGSNAGGGGGAAGQFGSVVAGAGTNGSNGGGGGGGTGYGAGGGGGGGGLYCANGGTGGAGTSGIVIVEWLQ
jgi:hypothetical protein